MRKWMDWKFFKWGMFGNVWAWFHIAGGAVLARFLSEFFGDITSIILVLLVTLLWELLEFIFDGGKEGMIKIYGSMERWFYDSLGDVTGAMFVASLVIF